MMALLFAVPRAQADDATPVLMPASVESLTPAMMPASVEPHAPVAPLELPDPLLPPDDPLDEDALLVLAQHRVAALGPLSIGTPDAGLLVNPLRMPDGPYWTIRNPLETYGTAETIDFIVTAVEDVEARFPGSPRLVVGDVSRRDGGRLNRHRSHQAGRDVDLGFYYAAGEIPDFRTARRKDLDLPRMWALFRALITETDVDRIFVDRSIIAVLYAYARDEENEDVDWLDDVFGRRGEHHKGVIQHERGHKNHLHVRFFNQRAQEHGRIVYPVLVEEGVVPPPRIRHRVARGETIGRPGGALRHQRVGDPFGERPAQQPAARRPRLHDPDPPRAPGRRSDRGPAATAAAGRRHCRERRRGPASGDGRGPLTGSRLVGREPLRAGRRVPARHAFEQPRRLVVDQHQLSVLPGDEAIGHRVVHQRRQRVVVAGHVEHADRLAVDAELAPGEYLEQLLERTDSRRAARRSRRPVSAISALRACIVGTTRMSATPRCASSRAARPCGITPTTRPPPASTLSATTPISPIEPPP